MLSIACAVYKRPQLTKIVLDYYAALKEKYNLVLIAVGSEGDASRQLCEGAGWHYYECPNQPLSYKIDYLFAQVRNFNVQGMVWIGSDNLLTEPLLQYYIDNYNASTPAVMALDEIYFYSVFRDECMHFKFMANKNSSSLGVGRYHSKAVLDRMNYTPCGHNYSRGIDLQHTLNFKKLGIAKQIFNPGQQAFAIDIKVDECMTTWEMWKDHPTSIVDKKILYDHFPNQMQLIEALRAMQTGVEVRMF